MSDGGYLHQDAGTDQPVSYGALVFALLRFGNSVQPGQPPFTHTITPSSWQPHRRRVVVIDHRSSR